MNQFLPPLALFLLVSAATVSQTSSPRAAPQQPKSDYSFTVSTKDWTDTNLDLQPGDRVHIIGGVVNCQSPTLDEKAHLPLPSGTAGSLLAKLHLEEPPVSVPTDADLPIVSPSHLFLGINCAHHNGKPTAKVHVDWHQSRATPQ